MDPHSVLGVSRSASKEEVKQAWRKAVRESHPDLHTNSPDHIQRQAVQEAYGRITAGSRHTERHQRQRSSAAYSGHQSSGQTDWAHVRNAKAYRRQTGYGAFAAWFHSSRAYTTPRAVRQQATLVVAAIVAMMTLDAVTNAAWNSSNHGRLYGSVAKEAEQRLQAKTQQRDHSQSASAAKGASFEGQAPVVPVSQAASAESSPQ